MRIGPLNSSKSVARSSGAKGKDSASAPSASGAAPSAQDAASIMGVPEAELTPNVQRALLSLMGEVDQLRKETEALRRKVRDLETLADHDAMLPVLNRRAFLREVSRALALAERHDAPSSLIYLDMNGFKAVNDAYGHAAGDDALRHVASLITAHVRETDAVGRLGGDEFGVVLTLTDPEAAEIKAADLVRRLEEKPFRINGREVKLSAAWGAAALAAGGEAESALAAADAAMYARKSGDGDRRQA